MDSAVSLADLARAEQTANNAREVADNALRSEHALAAELLLSWRRAGFPQRGPFVDALRVSAERLVVLDERSRTALAAHLAALNAWLDGLGSARHG